MKTNWKLYVLLYGAFVQLALLRLMTYLLFSARAGTYQSYSLAANFCAAALGSLTLTWLIGNSITSISHGQKIPTRVSLAWSGISGLAATTLTYEVLLFAASMSITSHPTQGGSAPFTIGGFLFILFISHVYTFFAFLPVAALGFVSGVIAGWFLLRVGRTNSTSEGPPLVPTRP
jgi:hypothetical protein